MNRKNACLAFLLFSLFSDLPAQNVFTIEEVIHRAQTQSPAFKQTETTRETKYWVYRSFRTNYNPQVQMNNFGGGTLFSNSITQIRQPDGSFLYLPVNQINPGINFALQQPIQWTGGLIAVNSNYNYFKDISARYTQWNGSPMNISLFQPLLSYNAYKWDKKIQPIRFEESKREYAEGMEQIGKDAVTFFFNVMVAQVNLQIANYNLVNNDTIYKIEQGRYNIGTTSEDKLLQVELQLLRSRQDVGLANLALQTTSLDLRTYIGLRNGESFTLILPDQIPTIEVSEDEAIEHAKQTRMDFVAFERRKLEAESQVAFVRGQLYQVGINATYGLNNVGSTFNDLYRNPTKQQAANVTFNIPILDWGRRRAKMQTAYANKRFLDYAIAQDEVTFEQQILTKVRQFRMLYLQLEITKKSDEVALKRYNVAQNRYLIGKIDITNLNIALREKDDAKRSYITAIKDFWTAYFDLRKLTLYDFAERKFLYNPYNKD
ncbi:MAG TPA: TolC family protein, partial [Cyclobacteriaceae bacterium]|nr:TolC family protein [Cyclobacteriaceae bacterium]